MLPTSRWCGRRGGIVIERTRPRGSNSSSRHRRQIPSSVLLFLFYTSRPQNLYCGNGQVILWSYIVIHIIQVILWSATRCWSPAVPSPMSRCLLESPSPSLRLMLITTTMKIVTTYKETKIIMVVVSPMSPCILVTWWSSNGENDHDNDSDETKVSIPDETVKFSYDQQRQYILFQGTEVCQK